MKIKDLSLEMNDNNIKNIFFDWFCTNTELLRRGKKLVKLLLLIKLYVNNDYSILFKNHCPIKGNLFDSIYLNDEHNKIIFYIEHINRKYYITYKDDCKPCACLKTRKEFIQFFKNLNESDLENCSIRNSMRLKFFNNEIKKLNDKANAIIRQLNL